MQHAERRVRKLTLSGGNHSRLLQACYVVEEALRTASLPGIPPNAEVLVRRLELGELRTNLPVSLVADRITELVRNLAAAAVCVDKYVDGGADVVWFSNPVQPYVTLLRQLLDGKPTNQWYWRSLFPGRELALNTATIEWLLPASQQTPMQALAPAYLLQSALSPQRRTSLLSLITPELAQRLLHAAGVSPAVVSGRLPQSVDGEVVVYQHRGIPAPSVDADWRSALQFAVDHWSEEDVRTRWLVWSALVVHQPAWLECKESLQRIDIVEWLAHWRRCEVGGREIPPSPPLGKGGMGSGDWSRERRDGNVGDSPQNHLSAPQEDRLVSALHLAESTASTPNLQATSTSSPPLQRGARGDLPSDNHPPSSNNAPSAPDNHDHSVTPLHSSAFSHHAGFVFVIPLLQRLGIPVLLQQNQQLIELDFPRRLLHAIAERFKLPDDDPARCLFEACEFSTDAPVKDIQPPTLWSRFVLKQASIDSLHGLINTTQLMVGVYLRRYCKLSLRGLIQRPGQVALTATHWDVTFDINQTDLRLRRVALDTDPGWVAWLGRVVQFHYDREG